MKLTNMTVEKAKYKGGNDRLADGNHLYLRVYRSDQKAYQHQDKRAGHKVAYITLGDASEISLKQARALNSTVKGLFADGYSAELIRSALERSKSPSEVNRLVLDLETTDEPLTNEMTFKQMHEAWHAYKSPSWKNAVHRHQAMRNIAYYCYPQFGNMPISKVTTMHIVRALEPIWVEKQASAKRIKQWLGKIFEMAGSPRYQLITTNPANFSTEFMLPEVRLSDRHQPSVHYERAPDLWSALCNKPNSTRLAIAATKIVMLTAKRAGEVVNMRWQDVDLERAEWTVWDADQTKNAQPHRCPLPSGAIEILRALEPLTGHKTNVFYSANQNLRIALDVPRKTLQSAWGGRDVTAHGMRHTLKTWAMEVGYRKELSEMQLSHEEQGIEAVYNDADYLKDRKVMMQHWQDYLSGQVSLDERHRV